MSKDFIFFIPHGKYDSELFKEAVVEFLRLYRIRKFRFVRFFNSDYILKKIRSQELSGLGCIHFTDLSKSSKKRKTILQNTIENGIPIAEVSSGILNMQDDKFRHDICILQFLSCIEQKPRKRKKLRSFYKKYLQPGR